MATTEHSRRPTAAPRASFLSRLAAIMRAAIGIATGKSRRPGERFHPGPPVHARSARRLSRVWLVRRQVGALRLGLALALTLVFILIGWHIVSETAALRLADSAPAKALRWAPHSPAALDQVAQKELKTGGDLNAAQLWAQEALRLRPLDNLSLFLLGIVAERKGDAAAAKKLIGSAGARTWRNLGTQIWLFEHAYIAKDYAAALPHADAMFRVEPRLISPVFPTIAAFTTDPRGLKALAEFLVTDPPWRQWVVQSLANRLYSKTDLDRFYAMLSDSRSPPTKPELLSYMQRLIKDGRYDTAYRKWRASLPASQSTAGLLYNGDFSLPIDDMPFNWVMGRVAGAHAQIVSPDDAKGRALRVEFSGARINFDDVSQLMLLPPGRYRLAGRVKADNLRTSRGLWWRILCVTGSKATLAHTDPLSGNVPWRDFQADFEVPAEGCKAQKLQLELPARIASEHEIEGQVWYQDIRIAPLDRAAGPAR
jgi:hypothetical protein